MESTRAANIAKCRATREQYAMIRSGVRTVTFSTIYNWIKNKMMKKCSVNREQVKNHPSDANLILDSLAKRIPIGAVTAYVQGVACPDVPHLTGTIFLDEFEPTETSLILLPDFGHRSCFIQDIANGTATYAGFTLAELKTADLEIYDIIMNTHIPIDIRFSTTGIVPTSYISKLFNRLQLSTAAVVGEQLHAGEDQRLTAVLNDFSSSFSEHLTLNKSRNADLATIAALTFGSSDHTRMNIKKTKKDNSLVDENRPLTEEQDASARIILSKICDILTAVTTNINRDIASAQNEISQIAKPSRSATVEEKATYKAAEKKVNDAKARLVCLKKRGLDISLYAPIVTGLRDDQDNTAFDNAVQFFILATQTSESWKTIIDEVISTGAGPAGSSTYNRHKAGWIKMLVKIGKNPNDSLEHSNAQTIRMGEVR